jgi:hypothetical protein
VVLLFKTPTANLGRNGASQHPDKRKAGGHGPTLDDEVSHLLPEPTNEVQDWGDFEPAIRRQESVTGRQAPVPTEIGPRGGRRLTARFAEWLMGLADGWVTDVPGLTRAEQLHKIGNGVAPQQAYEAFRRLMTGDIREASCSVPLVFPTPLTHDRGKSTRALTSSSNNGRRSGGGQSSPLGLTEVVQLLAGERPSNLPPDELLPPKSRALVESFLRENTVTPTEES